MLCVDNYIYQKLCQHQNQDIKIDSENVSSPRFESPLQYTIIVRHENLTIRLHYVISDPDTLSKINFMQVY